MSVSIRYSWLKQDTKPGGVYLGVGPDQNFTYILALQPKIAFIIDIRRQNMLQHLMYKALIEISKDRADFTFAIVFAKTARESDPARHVRRSVRRVLPG